MADRICPCCGGSYKPYGSRQKVCSLKCKAEVMTYKLGGQRFGTLTAIERSEQRSALGILWMCQCDCGNRKTVLAKNLRAGRGVTCGRGCQSRRRYSDEFIATARELWDLGESMSAVGRRLGVTKNVIAGLSHRHDFPPRAVARP